MRVWHSVGLLSHTPYMLLAHTPYMLLSHTPYMLLSHTPYMYLYRDTCICIQIHLSLALS